MMGKSGDKDERGRGGSEEDRLLQKAKRFVEKQEQEKDRKKKSRRVDEDDRHHDRRGRKHSSRRGDEDHKDRDRHRSRKDRDDSSHRRKKKGRTDSRRRRERSRSRSRDDSEIDRPRKHHKRSHRRDDDDDDKQERHKKRKRDDKKDSKKDKKKKNSKEHADRKKHSDGDTKKTKVDLSKLYPLGPVASTPPATKLEPEADYFAYHDHFRLYLYRSDGIYFEDLSSTDAHKEFATFATRFNDGRLEEGYYSDKLPLEALEQCKRTQHKWAFKTNATEKQSLEMVRAGVRKQTEWSADNTKPSSSGIAAASAGRPTVAMPGTSAGGGDDGRRRKTPEEMAAERAANRRLREHVQVTHAELTDGRADYGRARQLEKRREKAEALHGSAKDREAEVMGGPDLGDEDIYGGRADGKGSFQEALAREKARKSKREQRKAERIGELQRKEDAKAKAMLDMLGLSGIKPGEKIKIAPRKDG